MKTFPLLTALSFGLASTQLSIAQDESQVPADLKYTQEISTRFRIVVNVTLQVPRSAPEEFQYDRYPLQGLRPGVERIKRSEGVFARPVGKEWLRSDDWGDTGTPVANEFVKVLDTDSNIVAVPFLPPTNQDKTQGAMVWRFFGKTPHEAASELNFEMSREHPHANVDYPKFSFLKAPGDRDGRLFLCGFAGYLKDSVQRVAVAMRFAFYVPVPAGTQVQVFDKVTHREEYHTVVGPDSGWEITAQSSDPTLIRNSKH